MSEITVKPPVKLPRNWLQKLRFLSWSDRWLLVEALFWLVLMGAAIQAMPFRRVLHLLRLETGEGFASETPGAAVRIGWAISAVARRTPWLSTCLAQALAGKAMLGRRGIPATLYLGVAKSPVADLQAHAWLRCGEHILTGAMGHERFNVIAKYA